MMSKILSAWIFFAGLVFATNAYVNQCPVGTKACDCFNPFFISKPTSIQECSPAAKYRYQVQQNYNKIYSQLSCENVALGCNLSKYQEVLNGIRSKTEDIINAFYSSTDEQCESAVLGAYDKYAQYRTTFNLFTRCSFTNYSPQCAQLILGVRPLVYDPRPIPTSERECFSPEFIAKLRNFTNVNFDKIDNVYSENKSPECPDYLNFEQNVKDFRAIGIEVTKILEKSDPKFADIIEIYDGMYITLVTQSYSPGVRRYIVDNTENCYFPVRLARIYPTTIVDAVFAAVTKCVKYKDAANGIC